jgi:hypothetical protein
MKMNKLVLLIDEYQFSMNVSEMNLYWDLFKSTGNTEELAYVKQSLV